MVYIKRLKILYVFTVGAQDWNMNKAALRKLLSLLKKKTANVGTDQNWKLLSDLAHFHCSDLAEPGFDYVQALGDNRPQLRSPARNLQKLN